MAQTANKTLTGAHEIDGHAFVNVEFKNATLTYTGGPPPSFQNCRFEHATFAFTGPAGATLQFLNAMAPSTTNMRHIVDGLMPALKG